jgi:creatinine amidohydrolase
LAELTSLQAQRLFSVNPRLLVPVGTLLVRGPHLPLGVGTLIVDRLADDLSARTRTVRAPVIPFGVHASTDREDPGSAGLTRKTLHRMLNELIAAWENEAKVREIMILSAHAGEAHNEALGTIRAVGHVTLIDIYGAQLQDLTGGQDPDTVLLAWLAPTLGSVPATGAADRGLGGKVYHRLLDHALQIIEPTR